MFSHEVGQSLKFFEKKTTYLNGITAAISKSNEVPSISNEIPLKIDPKKSNLYTSEDQDD